MVERRWSGRRGDRRAGDIGTVLTGTPMRRVGRGPELPLKRANVIHDIPAVRLLDSIVGRHHAAPIPDHAEDVAIGAALRDVAGEDAPDDAVSRGGAVALA